MAANSTAVDPNLISFLNNQRAGQADAGGNRDVICQVEALTAYRDQLRQELEGVEQELRQLAHALAR
jgi:hypothetical protein